MTDRNYQHSRPLDVHRWSEYKEVNVFVDEVYDDYFNTQSKENVRIKKKHLKVVLLDLIYLTFFFKQRAGWQP